MFGNRIPFRERMARFLYGRNGPDTLYNVCLWAALVLAVVGIFLDSLLFSLFYLLLMGYALFRFFSRNVAKRQAENQAFRRFFGRIKQFFSISKKKISDREHAYRKCPNCRSQLRLPRVKGEHTARCPRCGSSFSVKI